MRARLRDLGVVIGRFPTGGWNAITDVPGVTVGTRTIIADAPVCLRTGVTAIWPRPRDIIADDPVFAGLHSFNGNGELTGALWLNEAGLLSGPVCLTGTYAVGAVRDAVNAYAAARGLTLCAELPVVAETWDGWLSAPGAGATQADVFAALDGAQSGPVTEGNFGGGTGMICHEFKAGTGTASRRVTLGGEDFVVGALVQANYGRRDLLRVNGAPVGRHLDLAQIPSAHPRPDGSDSGSLVAVLATDAPLLPLQCQRLARRGVLGMARTGGIGADESGDIFLAFSTAGHPARGRIATVRTVHHAMLTDLFEAAGEAVEEAILNAMTAAETMTGQLGRIAPAVPLDQLVEFMKKAVLF
jgi:D-aminopeptidase